MGYFSDQEMNRRLANLRRAMDEQSVEAVLVTSVHNTLYYSNFWMIPWGREQGLVIPRDGEPAVIAPRIEYDRPAKMVGDGSGFRDIRIYADNASAIDGWVGSARQVLCDRGITSGRIGIEEDNVSITLHKALCAALPDLEFAEIGYAMMREQMLKSDEEIALIRDGDQVTVDAVTNAIDVDLSDEELTARAAEWTMPDYEATRGTLYKYIKNVKTASEGCVTDE